MPQFAAWLISSTAEDRERGQLVTGEHIEPLLKKIRANPLFQSLPVIIFSNTSLPGMVEEAWKEGATMVLSKSSHSPKQVVESVRNVLKTAGENQQKDALVATDADTPTAHALALT